MRKQPQTEEHFGYGTAAISQKSKTNE